MPHAQLSLAVQESADKLRILAELNLAELNSGTNAEQIQTQEIQEKT